ncbi:MAG: RNA 2',3'-cyclic phosphodiesterase [Gammaproteobacteria bacterium]
MASEKEPSRRLFFALWPDEALRQSLEASICRRLPHGMGRPVPLAHLHITLVFLGQVPVSRLPCVLAAPARVNAESFEMILDHIAYWPRPRVLWVGPRHTPGALFDLVGGLRRGLAPCAMELDQRPYQAHLTLLRKVPRPPPPDIDIAPVAWRVERYSLIESLPAQGGVSYRELCSWPLQGL